VERIERVQVALALGVPPAVVDEMSVFDRWDVLAVYRAQRQIEG